jgi:F0F1-type ATP synthase membrane subunit a
MEPANRSSIEPNHCQPCNRTSGGSTFFSDISVQQLTLQYTSATSHSVLSPRAASQLTSSHLRVRQVRSIVSAVGSPRTTPQLSPSQLQNTIDGLGLWIATVKRERRHNFKWQRFSPNVAICAFIDLLNPLPLPAIAAVWGKCRNWWLSLKINGTNLYTMAVIAIYLLLRRSTTV